MGDAAMASRRRDTRGVVTPNRLPPLAATKHVVPAAPAPLHLRGDGVSVVLDLSPATVTFPYWGAELGDCSHDDLRQLIRLSRPGIGPGAYDVPLEPPLVPTASTGWSGRPCLLGRRDDGSAWTPHFRLAEHAAGPAARRSAVIDLVDDAAGLTLRIELSLEAAGLLRVRWTLRNMGTSRYLLESLVPMLPVPDRAREVLDLTGRWARERHPQRRPLAQGAWLREGRRGRPGHDATLLLVIGTQDFGFQLGEVWAVHTAWSGNHIELANRTPSGHSVVAAGELLEPGEVVLAPGEQYQAPDLLAGYSANGLDGLSAVFHEWVRARPSHPRAPRPLTLNTWEAVYFDHEPATLFRLAEAAADLGVERFVLDDGWFLGRRDDSAGLGDWLVDPAVWPDGLAPLSEHVHRLGMQFGLWVEPEMLQRDSELFRSNPEWRMSVAGREPMSWRRQHVVDLGNPTAYAHIRDRLVDLVTTANVDCLKWDHNRDLGDAGRTDDEAQQPAVRRQTLAVHRLLADLTERFPHLEIESCSSGGARADLGILQWCNRVWASDTNDALERQTIQRWTALLLPPELIGCHVGPPMSHTTGRRHDLSLRLATAVLGHAGLEWDVTALDAQDRVQVRSWARWYKAHREMLHTGRTVRSDDPDGSYLLNGVVSHDRSRAVFVLVTVASTPSAALPSLRLPGLGRGPTVRNSPRILVHAARTSAASAGVVGGRAGIDRVRGGPPEVGCPAPRAPS